MDFCRGLELIILSATLFCTFHPIGGVQGEIFISGVVETSLGTEPNFADAAVTTLGVEKFEFVEMFFQVFLFVLHLLYLFFSGPWPSLWVKWQGYAVDAVCPASRLPISIIGGYSDFELAVEEVDSDLLEDELSLLLVDVELLESELPVEVDALPEPLESVT